MHTLISVITRWLYAAGLSKIAKRLQKLVAKMGFLELANVARQEKWEVLWRQEASRPDHELSTELPAELIDAVTSKWFKPGGHLLDIGSGRGQISAWFAENGFNVVGADFSADATELAKKHFGHLPSLEFVTRDVVRDSLGENRFDILIDRGCVQTIDPKEQRLHVENIAAAAAPDARYIVFHPLTGSREALTEQVHSLFNDYFEILSCENTIEPMTRSEGPIPRTTMPGLVYKMVRRLKDS